MAKRISEVQRVTAYFQTADESAATVMFQVIKGIMEARFKPQQTKKTRGPNKPKDPPAEKASAASGD